MRSPQNPAGPYGSVPPRMPVAPADPPDRHWWAAPALATAAAPVLAHLDAGALPGGWTASWWALVYLLPLVLVAASWLVGRTARWRRPRIVLGAAGCALAWYMTEALTTLLVGVWLLGQVVRVVDATLG
ncbi:hypothetical protein [Streptomyces sp. NPDC001985]|uniref:hypothetical protein n=1 Tax=Streptomyces sp. NPDC001985 TaxID=3154406 RepID=UPI00332C82E7